MSGTEDLMIVEQLLRGLIEDGPFAILCGGLLWWLAVRQEKFLSALARQQRFGNLLLVGLQKELLAHDLTVTGINPSMGADADERSERAIQKYEEIYRVFSTIEQHLREDTA